VKIYLTQDDIACLASVFGRSPLEEGVNDLTPMLARGLLRDADSRRPALPEVRPHWKDKLQMVAMQSDVDTLRVKVRDLRIEKDRLQEELQEVKTHRERLYKKAQALEAGYPGSQIASNPPVTVQVLEQVVEKLGGIPRSKFEEEVSKRIQTAKNWENYEEPGY